MIDPSAPLSSYHDNTTPGATQKTVGLILLLASLVFWIYLHRENDLERWFRTEARVESTSIQQVYHSRRYGGYTTYDVYVNAKYPVEGKTYYYAGCYRPGFYSYSSADGCAKTIINAPIAIRYNPVEADRCITEGEFGVNHATAPVVSIVLALTGGIGIIFFVAGWTAKPAEPLYESAYRW